MNQHQSPKHNGHLEDDDENRLDTHTEEAEDQARQRRAQELERPHNLSSTMASKNLPVSETVMQDSQAAAKHVSCILLY